jgi:hypothetical protein
VLGNSVRDLFYDSAEFLCCFVAHALCAGLFNYAVHSGKTEFCFGQLVSRTRNRDWERILTFEREKVPEKVEIQLDGIDLPFSGSFQV